MRKLRKVCDGSFGTTSTAGVGYSKGLYRGQDPMCMVSGMLHQAQMCKEV